MKLFQIKTKTNTTPLEDDECKLLVDYLLLLQNQGKVIKFGHINNEMYTKSWKQKRRNKDLFVATGYPDYVIILNTRPFYTMLYIEMKRIKGSSTSEIQKEWNLVLNKCGNNVEAYICKGFEAAREVIDNKLK